MALENETANALDARVDALWATLDTRKQGQLDLAALKRGLRKMDHRTLPRWLQKGALANG